LEEFSYFLISSFLCIILVISNEISKLRSVNKVKTLDKHTNRKNKTTSQKSSLKQSSQVLNETNAEEKCTVVNLDHLLLKEQEGKLHELKL
jgi:hypothetical protein